MRRICSGSKTLPVESTPLAFASMPIQDSTAAERSR